MIALVVASSREIQPRATSVPRTTRAPSATAAGSHRLSIGSAGLLCSPTAHLLFELGALGGDLVVRRTVGDVDVHGDDAFLEGFAHGGLDALGVGVPFAGVGVGEFVERGQEPVELLCVAEAVAIDVGERRSEEHTSELQSREKLVCR